MIGLVERIALRALFALDPEDGHTLALKALRLAPRLPDADDPRLAVTAFGLRFPNPVGNAAGFDKNGEAVEAILRAGFGFAEAGTVTPRPQAGNPRPRLFRLAADGGVINRMGFNNAGHAALLRRLTERRGDGIVGVNIGANKDSEDRVADYVAGIAAFSGKAGYFTVNVSSPNTPGLRDLQQAGALDDLLARVMEAREQRPTGERRPILLKIAPDLALGDLDDIVAVARRRRVDGMIVANTTISRPASLSDRATALQAGGLSGRPLYPLATRMLAETFLRVEGAFPLVGAGGVDSGATAWGKIAAGATLVQLYSGLVYQGIGLVRTIKRYLAGELTRQRLPALASVIGRDAARLCAEPWPDQDS